MRSRKRVLHQPACSGVSGRIPAGADLRVCHVASEVAPFSKTGGLADVAGALPRALADAGLDLTVLSPCHRSVSQSGKRLRAVATLEVPAAGRIGPSSMRPDSGGRRIRLLECRSSRVRHLFVDEPGLFDRDGIYGDSQGDYPDNALRFAVFCQTVLRALSALELKPDLIHCHDWQTALIPLLLSEQHPSDTGLAETPTVLTIHNLGYQGNFSPEAFSLLGVRAELFSPQGIEYYGKVSFLKAGLLYATALTTVSPTHAAEIQTPEFGFGFDGILSQRRDELHGILNAIDVKEWNPRTDKNLDARYSQKDLAGKRFCKAALVKELKLESPAAPLFGSVTRLAGQKGIDLIIKLIPELVRNRAQVALLGAGAPEYETALKALQERYPGAVSVTIGFSELLAHRIYAGADFFLMPSLYEPCGLGQMIALRYGTLPIATRTGGLVDTVVDLDESPETGNGYLFGPDSTERLLAKVKQALRLAGEPARLDSIRSRSMRADFSWPARAQEYVRLYSTLAATRTRES